MSSWAALHEQLYRLDHTIINKLEVLVNNQLSNDEYLDSNTSKLLEDPLIFSNFENYDFTEVPRENLLDVIDILKKEKIELTRIFNEVDRERKTLRQQNFKLMERLFIQENFETQKIDRDFNRFLSKSFFLHYELYKKFLENERERNEQLRVLLEKKDIELKQVYNKVAQLEEKVLQTRDMWKKSILETSTSSTIPIPSNKSYTPKFSLTPKSPVAGNATHMTLNDTIFKQNAIAESKRYGSYQTKGVSPLPIENDVEASINDKIQNKIKELMNGKASPANRNNDAHGNISNRSLILDKSLLGLTIHEDNFSEVDDEVWRHTPIGQLKSDNDLDKLKELKSEPNLDKSHTLRGKMNKTSIEANGSKNSPKKQANIINSGGKSPIDDAKKTLGRSASQKTVGFASSKVGSAHSTLKNKGASDKLNSTTNFELNTSNDNLNKSILSTTDNDSRKTYSDSKKKFSSTAAKVYTNNLASATTKPKTTTGTAKSINNLSALSSPKNQITKPKLNINSSPMPVKKK